MENQTENKVMTREEVLASALAAREQEVMMYQINIDNYTLALMEIAKREPTEQAELAKFTEQLQTLLASEQLEQKKALIMLSVIKQQVE